jgi:hypothetical protein
MTIQLTRASIRHRFAARSCRKTLLALAVLTTALYPESGKAESSAEVHELLDTPAVSFEMAWFAGAPQPKRRLATKGVASLWELGGEVRATVLRYLSIGIGLRGVFGTDKQPFQQAACEEFSGKCYTVDSAIESTNVQGKIGGLYRLSLGESWDLVAEAALGYQTLALKRSIPDCDDCKSVSLHTRGGFYLTPSVDLMYVFPDGVLRGLGLQLGGEIFLSGDLRSALWAGMVMRYL